MTRFNLSEWALRHKSFVVYLMLVSAAAGAWSYVRLGREEDPAFTIKTMIVTTYWPGATTIDTLNEVTDRIEKKLEEVPYLDYVKSYTKPGVSTVYMNLLDSTPAAEVPKLWQTVRNKINDIRHTLPQGVQGPYYNDDFGDVYSIIYALTGDGFSFRELRDFAETVRSDVLRAPDVSKIELIGTQDEKIYLEFSTLQMAALGIDISALMQTLQEQNAVTPSGVVDAGPERITIRVSGAFVSEKSLRAINIRSGNKFFRLGDIVKVKRGYADPPQPIFRFNGHQAIGVAISMTSGGDVLALGENVRKIIERARGNLPVGVDLQLVADQPVVVKASVAEFMKSLEEAVIIVLAVSFFALGLRPGVVVAVAIPLVLGVTFVAMEMLSISLQRISLGALIISLGLLVDDAMIAVEMMISKLEEGFDKVKAATFAYTSTAFPMLTGTLVTIAGFVPVGFARSSAGEYCFSLFAVIAVALVVSWIVAVLFTPLTGVFILPDKMEGHGGGHGGSGFYGRFERVLDHALRWKGTVLAIVAAMFVASLVGMNYVQQQFFPASDRPELLVDLTLPQSSSIYATEEVVARAEKIFKEEKDIVRWSFYVGQGAIRFYLPLDAQLTNDFFAQAVVVTKGYEERPGVKKRLEEAFSKGFDNVMVRVNPLELGPPVGWPLKFRVSGPDPEKTRELSHAFARLMAQNHYIWNINYDWNEPSKVIRVEVDQDQARAAGLSSEQVSKAINAVLTGATVTQVRDSIYLIDVVARAVADERAKVDTLRSLMLAVPGGDNVPLAQIATLDYGLEMPLIWRRERLPTVTVQAELSGGMQAATIVKELTPAMNEFRAKLPAGYRVEVGGTVEDSGKAERSIFAVFPVMVLLIITILMVQLMSFQRMFMVLLTAPLALIGVAAALLSMNVPMGFVAILGVIALIGMVIRNSVILIVQIDQHIADGEHPWEAVKSATVHRMRPILLTAAAAILGMVPIAPTVFWGPMAYAIMGGLLAATLLTLIFLPALYVAWFRIKPPEETGAP